MATAPVCPSCKTLVIGVGGVLGVTSAYGLNDPSLTRARIEADLAACRNHHTKLRGMLEACKQQMDWTVERYAQFPPPPLFLEVQRVPSLWEDSPLKIFTAFVGCLPAVIVMFFLTYFITGLVIWVIAVVGLVMGDTHLAARIGLEKMLEAIAGYVFWLVFLGACVAVVRWWTADHRKAKRANGSRPAENARRQKAYEGARVAALKAAEPTKAAEVHRLRVRIRKLEGLIQTVQSQEENVRRILATLP